jgi:outer membrane protein OmpA-like peptidoglycan-associated protein
VRVLLLVIPFLLTLTACQQPPHAEALQTSVIFFTEDSAKLDARASAVITETASFARARPNSVVHVLGFAPSNSGSVGYNHSLSQTRAAAVADGLVEAGVVRARIRIEPEGGVPYELAPIESRRVEIIVGS